MWFTATHIGRHTTYVIEPTRKGSRKLRAYCLPATGRELDHEIPLWQVPLPIRQAARAVLTAR